jgi:hypothetical protein
MSLAFMWSGPAFAEGIPLSCKLVSAYDHAVLGLQAEVDFDGGRLLKLSADNHLSQAVAGRTLSNEDGKLSFAIETEDEPFVLDVSKGNHGIKAFVRNNGTERVPFVTSAIWDGFCVAAEASIAAEIRQVDLVELRNESRPLAGMQLFRLPVERYTCLNVNRDAIITETVLELSAGETDKTRATIASVEGGGIALRFSNPLATVYTFAGFPSLTEYQAAFKDESGNGQPFWLVKPAPANGIQISYTPEQGAAFAGACFPVVTGSESNQ